MPTNLELLKSIHDNGGGLSNCCPKGQTKSYRDMTDEQLSHLGWFRANDGEIFRIPSELEVEEKIVELLENIELKEQFHTVLQITKGAGFEDDYWNYDAYVACADEEMYSLGVYYASSRLTAGLMLWDKLLKEKR